MLDNLVDFSTGVNTRVVAAGCPAQVSDCVVCNSLLIALLLCRFLEE